LFQIIEDKLATEGIQQYQYNFLSEGSHQSSTFNSESSWQVIDVRDLYDDDSNSLEDYDKKINLVWNAIQDYGKAVIKEENKA
jgi:hypothetical protein